tara:strand:+ start:6707 stop:6904 length:198 start_codon:yes stop_codon:yes gene_type:complete
MEWRREFPDKYYEEDKMASAGNYILDELIKQINLLRKENERLTKENLELKEKSSSSFAEVLKQGN